MNNFGQYVKPAEAKEFGDANGDLHPLEYWQKLARRRPGKCENCDELEWKYARTGLCFSCTSGEASADDDTEIEP